MYCFFCLFAFCVICVSFLSSFVIIFFYIHLFSSIYLSKCVNVHAKKYVLCCGCVNLNDNRFLNTAGPIEQKNLLYTPIRYGQFDKRSNSTSVCSNPVTNSRNKCQQSNTKKCCRRANKNHDTIEN